MTNEDENEAKSHDDKSSDRLMIIDASSLIYPAFHVMGGLKTRSGFPTGAIYGFARTILMLLRRYPAQYVAVAFDSAGRTRRQQVFPEYKAHRPPIDEALVVQFPKVKELTDILQLARLEQPSYEADDLIAALTEKARQQKIEVLIVSSDKDLLQLVDEHVFVLRPGRDPSKELRLLNAEGVQSYLGVRPDQVADYLTLMGDSVDNIPGVPGVGEKTAKKLLTEFDSLENLWAEVERVQPPKLSEKLVFYRQQAQLSRDLVRLDPPILEISLHDCERKSPNINKLLAFFEELEFRRLAEEIKTQFNAAATREEQPQAPKISFEMVLTEEDLEKLMRELATAAAISLDTETTSRNALDAELVGLALSVQSGAGFYLPLTHDYLGVPPQLEHTQALSKLKPILESKPIIGQNLKYDAHVLRTYGIELKKIAFDSLLAEYLLDPEARKNLKELALKYLGYPVMDFDDLGAETMRVVPIERAAEYAVRDAEAVLHLQEKMCPLLKEKRQERLFYEIELPLIPVLVAMESTGILLDKEILKEQAKELETLSTQLMQDIFHLAGQDFNPNSPQQVAHILFERLKLPVLRKTKTGPSTNAYVLQELALLHPLPEKLLAYRELEKLLNTYIKKLPGHIHPRTGRVHTNFQQHIAVTGRLSSTDPNLQNIPVRTELGGQIRKAFVAPPDRLLISADYSQIELRVLAHLSGDKGLIEAFERDEDVHTRTAATIFNISIENVSSQQRRIAKMINFGLSYGMTGYGLAQRTGIPRKEAEQFIKSYFEKYPGVKIYMERIVREAKENRCLETLLGRRRYFSELSGQTQREAINFPVQGSAADIVKLAMLRVFEKLQKEEIRAKIILQVHDELIFEADADQAEQITQSIKEAMESAFELRVALKTETHVGANWGEI